MHPGLQVVLTILATIAAIVSTIVAWKSQILSRKALEFQKKLARHQDSIFLLRSTIAQLHEFKRILANPYLALDEGFGEAENIHHQISANLQSLIKSSIISQQDSLLFKVKSFEEIINHPNTINKEVDYEINQLQEKIEQIFL